MPTCPTTSSRAALFGEASYDFGQFKLTARRPLLQLQGRARLHLGRAVLQRRQIVGDKTKSSGFSPRAIIATWEPSNNLNVNVQAAKGFRLGGVNDPLNLPLCDNGVPNGSDAATFGGFRTYRRRDAVEL